MSIVIALNGHLPHLLKLFFYNYLALIQSLNPPPVLPSLLLIAHSLGGQVDVHPSFKASPLGADEEVFGLLKTLKVRQVVHLILHEWKLRALSQGVM